MKRLLTRFRAFHRWQRIALIGGAVLTAALLTGWTWLTWDLPAIGDLDDGLALPSTRIFDREGRLLYEILADSDHGGRNLPIPLEQIPPHCIQAVISTEDANFYDHPGVDLIGIVRAAWINLQGGEIAAGGSTITQQVARITLLDAGERAERTVRRKLREMLLAVQLHNRYSKADVLALYLNQAYFGNLAYGIEGAARAYFGKSAAELSLAECALLAGLLQSPAVYDPLTNLDAAKARQDVVLGLMQRDARITAEQAESARREPLQFAASPFPIQAPHFVMAVIRQLERDYPDGLTRDGLDVITTLDLGWLTTAQTIVQRQLAALNDPANPRRPVPANAHNAALVALDPHTGQVMAMLGSPDYFDDSIDGAVNAALALRQPGSTLKPFTYAAALDPDRPAPWTAATMMLDVETPFVTRRLESYTPANFGLAEHGPVLVREALASSLNIPAVIALDQVGIPAMIELTTNAGITSLATNTQVDLSVTLGGGEVRLLELTQAYSVFANGGTRVDPVMLLEVRTRAGDVLYRWNNAAPRLQVIDHRLAWLITNILSDDNARLAGFGRGSALNIGRPAAAKTGTTTDTRDNWIVGYTPEVVVGVWVGNADNTPMIEVTGISGAAPIWNAFMRAVLNGVPESTFERPAGLTRIEVCALSGMLPTESCPNTRYEWFIEGTEPTEPDTIFQMFTLDSRTGGLAGEDTPPEYRVQRPFATLPQEAQDWAIRNGYPPPPGAIRTRLSEAESGLRLLEPDPYTTFQLSPLIPRSSQRLRLTVGVPPGVVNVTYRLNGSDIARVADAPYALWWPLEIGEFELIAVAQLEDGTQVESLPIPFSVVDTVAPQSRTEGE
ncbi:MAG: PBP1A family penicillin-binding protein [bacterium]|nr:PBP1A family penicillin-binding protein [bacterium]